MSTMSKIAELERLSSVNHRVTITIIGDPSKTILLPMWGSVTHVPGAWSSHVSIGKTKVVGVMWDIMMGSIVHMFPSDSVDHTVLFYDMCLRETDMRSRKYSIADYLKHITDMKGNHKSTTCIIVAQDKIPGRGEVIRACKQKGIKNIYVVNNTGKDIGSLKSLISDILAKVYNSRREEANKKIKQILNE